MFRKRDEKGRFLTWLIRRDDSATWVDVNSVVNANVVFWLKEHPETVGAQRWLKSLIDEEREVGSSWHYPIRMGLYASLSRPSPNPTGVNYALRGLGLVIANRILSSRDRSGHYGDAKLTAQALSALDGLYGWPAHSDAGRAAEQLLATQCVDGSWESGLVWQGPPPPNLPSVGFASPALITAYCIESLSRYARQK